MILRTPIKSRLDHREHLLSVWSKLSQANVRDTEIYVQISNAETKKIARQLETITKQATFRKKDAIAKGRGIDVDATFRQEKAIEAQARIHMDSAVLYTAVVVLVYRKTEDELRIACDKLANTFSPGVLVREEEVCLQTWLELQLFNNLKFLDKSSPFTERRYKLDSITARRVVPISKPQSLHDRGVEFVNDEGGLPVHLNLLENNERAIILGEPGSGKSLLGAEFITQALAENARVVVVDMSNDGTSTFKSYVEQLGHEGAYINLTGSSHFNILQPPDLSKLDLSRAKIDERLDLWKQSLQAILVAMVLGESSSSTETFNRIDGLILNLLKTFFLDDDIYARYAEAFKGGWKSEAWKNMPTLEDLLFFCTIDKLNLECTTEDDNSLKWISNQFKTKIADPNIGKAISSVSNVPPSPRLTMFALSGLNNENNSYIMSLVAQMACLNVSLESLVSLAVLDEATELIQKNGFARTIAHRFTRGRKEGQSMLLIGQDIETIAKSEVGSSIIKNTSYWIVGNIKQSNAIDSYTELLRLPLEAIIRNRGSSFKPSKKTMSSSFLLKSKDYLWHAIYFPSSITLAVTVNSQRERAARERVLRQFPNNILGIKSGLAEFGRQIYQAYSQEKSIDTVGHTIKKNHEQKNDRDRAYVGAGNFE